MIIDSEHLKGPADFPKEDNTPTGQSDLSVLSRDGNIKHPQEVDAVRPLLSPANTPGWLVRTVPNKFPVLTSDGTLQKEGIGIYDQMNGIGAHEVLIEVPGS